MSDLTESDIDELLTGSIDDVVANIKETAGSLTDDELADLLQSEVAGDNREAVVEAINLVVDAKTRVNQPDAPHDGVPDLLNGTVSAVKKALASANLDAETLTQLAELEAENGNRAGVLKEINRLIIALRDDDAEAAEPGAVPDWQKDDYTGPLTADQAEWINNKRRQAEEDALLHDNEG